MILNEYFQEVEGYKIPDLLMEALLSDGREALLAYLKERTPDMSIDSLRDDYQNEHGDRDKLKQDFTPDDIAKIVRAIVGESPVYADICAGTGALTIANMTGRDGYEVYCEEYSKRTIPFLLANLALRNVKGTVVNGDSLTGEVFATYILTPTDTFSVVEQTQTSGLGGDTKEVIMNPPYSLRWQPIPRPEYDGWPTLPNVGDYAFLLKGLSVGDRVTAILPHGILFRGAKEGKLRQRLIEKNYIESIIGLPNNMFMNTSIPVLILVLNKNKNDDKVLFVDASNDFEKAGKVNVITKEQRDKLVAVVNSRLEVKKYSHLATMEELKENDYNLNIPRYVDTFEEPPPIDIVNVMKELIDITKEEKKMEKEMADMMADIVATDPSEADEWNEVIRLQKELSEL